jgi:predicted translin family RNA/ssDNA-binding protein
MDYKSLMGYGKIKKSINKKQKKHSIVENIKLELNEWNDDTFKGKLNEVGSAPQHKKMLKNIEKAEENLHKHVLKYKNFLQSQGLNDEANEFSSKYVGFVGKFTHYTKTKWVKMLRKMI